jgi:thiosulfate/3-mercaptopyruvate sulfurtransferase
MRVALLVALTLCTSAQGAGGPPAGAFSWAAPFVQTKDVPEDARVIVLDARDRGEWAAGHIPDAIHILWTDYRAGFLREGRLPKNLEDTAMRLAERGVRSDRPVLVCGAAAEGWGEEGRIAWMLRYLGHENVAILDGGCLAWRAAGRPWTKKPTPQVIGTFHARPKAALRADKRATLAATRDDERSGVQLLDVRRREEYDGATPYFSSRGGHIPGAEHLPLHSFLDDKGHVRPKSEVLAALRRAGVDPKRPVIAYCTGGVRSAFVTEVLRSVGVDARNYDGSFWEWSADRALPVERSQKRRGVATD